jgi:pilus assembly protein Flp/PilA
MLIRFLNDESGATAIEYALIAAGVGLAVSAAASQLNTDLGEYFKAIGTKLDGTQPK